jgi:hypothetical protein
VLVGAEGCCQWCDGYSYGLVGQLVPEPTNPRSPLLARPRCFGSALGTFASATMQRCGQLRVSPVLVRMVTCLLVQSQVGVWQGDGDGRLITAQILAPLLLRGGGWRSQVPTSQARLVADLLLWSQYFPVPSVHGILGVHTGWHLGRGASVCACGVGWGGGRHGYSCRRRHTLHSSCLWYFLLGPTPSPMVLHPTLTK